jgi:hypothetical protein
MENNMARNFIILSVVLIVGLYFFKKNGSHQLAVPVSAPVQQVTAPAPVSTPQSTPVEVVQGPSAAPSASASPSATPLVVVAQAPAAAMPLPKTQAEMMAMMDFARKKRAAAFASEAGARAAIPDFESCVNAPSTPPQIPEAVKSQMPPEMLKKMMDAPRESQKDCISSLRKIGEKFPSLRGEVNRIISHAP